ncbi:MAG TPA: crotonase/enoyl-CoA hydratase family protein [Nevskiaceae bacterium]|nr:crotonase/enoyl-CoA hydratase family protein [Nevskiaceae bacterium]
MAEPVLLERDGHLAIVTLNRPEARNAVTMEMAHALEAHIDTIEADPALWVVVLTGAGPSFCAGVDLKAVAAAGRDLAKAAPVTPRGGFGGIVNRKRTKPWIVAVEGAALAGGTEIVLSCDLVVAARDAVFGLPEVKRGLVAGAGGTLRLPRVLPLNLAMHLVLTGERLEAERAHAHGWVTVLAEPGGARAAAVALAQQILANAPLSVRESRQLLLDGLGKRDEEGFALVAPVVDRLMRTNDLLEGPRAFAEKREPRWTGT